jgi:pilus assembly protein CpaF
MKESELIKALGPLASLYLDETVQEVIVDGPGKVYVEKQEGLQDAEIVFESTEALTEMIKAVLALAGVILTPNTHSADIRLPDISRFMVTMPPTAVNGPYLVIHKPLLGTGLTWQDLIKFGSVNQEIIDLVQSALDAEVNILMVGGAKSGKTTLLNLIAGSVPTSQRIVAVEDIHSLKINHPRTMYLESQAAGVPMQSLIETASRMRPDWLVVKELRGPEALVALQVFNSGRSGMAKIHAESINDALNRLETMCLSANLGLGLQDIQGMIGSAFQMILYLEYLPIRKRRITEMVELQGLENNRYLLQPLMRYNRENDSFETVNAAPTWRNPLDQEKD